MSFKTPEQIQLPIGTVIHGKWNGAKYTILKQLGKGANGAVFLTEKDGQQVALKVCAQGADLALEFKILTSLVQGSSSSGFGPYPIELDDWVNGNSTLFFYSMEYIKGEPVEKFINRNGPLWVGAFLLQLLGDLEYLHERGYCFGDLKAENLLVCLREARVRLVDFGGVSAFGKSIREFTEWYDRAFWNMGHRKADIAYDLFSTAQLLVKLTCPKLSNSTYAAMDSNDRPGALRQLLKTEPLLAPWKGILEKAWSGKYKTAKHMRADVAVLQQDWLSQERKKKAVLKASRMKKARRKWDWTDWSILAASVLAVSVLSKMFLP